jgi:hypothetical protein
MLFPFIMAPAQTGRKRARRLAAITVQREIRKRE